MSNLSYCRFQNTARDLRDCLNAIEDGQIDDLSFEEFKGIQQILQDCETLMFMKEEIEDEIGVEPSRN
tara:strand:- start:309 stop:512 length:204 start_codon:yes stop_codon:yes gene_type:complete